MAAQRLSHRSGLQPAKLQRVANHVHRRNPQAPSPEGINAADDLDTDFVRFTSGVKSTVGSPAETVLASMGKSAVPAK